MGPFLWLPPYPLVHLAFVILSFSLHIASLCLFLTSQTLVHRCRHLAVDTKKKVDQLLPVGSHCLSNRLTKTNEGSRSFSHEACTSVHRLTMRPKPSSSASSKIPSASCLLHTKGSIESINSRRLWHSLRPRGAELSLDASSKTSLTGRSLHRQIGLENGLTAGVAPPSPESIIFSKPETFVFIAMTSHNANHSLVPKNGFLKCLSMTLPTGVRLCRMRSRLLDVLIMTLPRNHALGCETLPVYLQEFPRHSSTFQRAPQ